MSDIGELRGNMTLSAIFDEVRKRGTLSCFRECWPYHLVLHIGYNEFARKIGVPDGSCILEDVESGVLSLYSPDLADITAYDWVEEIH